MTGIKEFTTERLELEETLVRQFRALQDLIALTKKERTYLMDDPDGVLRTVEDKEALLDSMNVMDENCRNAILSLSNVVSPQTELKSIKELLPFFKNEDARRIKNLSEGINSLARQAQDLNRANQALAYTKLDWLKATQEFLISVFQPDTGYRAPKGAAFNREVTGLGVEVRV